MCDSQNKYITSQKINRDFLFIRHGQTSWGPGDITKGPQNLGLNEIGRCQANEAYNLIIENYNSIPTPIIFSSHLERALETANILASHFENKPLIIKVTGLEERYYGDYRNADTDNLSAYVPPDAESLDHFKGRVTEALRKILEQTYQDTRTLVLVSHQKVFEYLAELLTGEKLRLDQGGVCCFEFRDDKYFANVYESSSTATSQP